MLALMLAPPLIPDAIPAIVNLPINALVFRLALALTHRLVATAALSSVFHCSPWLQYAP